MKKFLGRIFDSDSCTWRFKDNSGIPLTEEFRQNFLFLIEKGPPGSAEALGLLFDHKEKYTGVYNEQLCS